MKTLSDLGEFGLIESLKKFQGLTPRVVKGVGDDAAVLKVRRGRYLLLTTDMLVEGVHFTQAMGARPVGYKAMACSLSDIAAMGGEPAAAVVSIGLPPGTASAWVQELYRGMRQAARPFGVSIAGGDTVCAGRVVINVAMTGDVEPACLVGRDGARPGDLIFVSGPLGGSLHSGRHLSFIPRVREARWLVAHVKPSAMMDISDGLAGDLRHILKASGVGALIQEDLIPCHPGVAASGALTDGEDFELLFTLPPRRAERLLMAQGAGTCCAYPLGAVRPRREGFRIITRCGRIAPVRLKGFRHF